jgi:hypothetical protein
LIDLAGERRVAEAAIPTKVKPPDLAAQERMDCFVACAPRNDGNHRHSLAIPRRDAPGSCKPFAPSEAEGAGECRVP